LNVSDVLNPLEEGATRHANHLALLSSRGGISYADYYRLANMVAEQLQKHGLKERDILAISMPVTERYPLLLLACFQLGIVACPLNTRWPLERQSSTALTYAAAVAVGDDDRTKQAFNGQKVISVDGLFTDPLSETPLFIEFDPNQPATLLFTSGSMGEAKAVLHAYSNHYYSARVSNRNIEMNPGDRWLLSLPLFHVSGIGIMFRCLLGGATVAIPEPDEDIGAALARLACTHVSLVPTQLYRLLNSEQGREALSKIKAVLIGGGPIPHDLVRRATAAGIPLFTTYGLTEMSSQVTTTRPGDGVLALYTAGKPHVVDSLKIAKDGEILVRGDALFRGYLHDDEIRLPLTRDGWFATGDTGTLDSLGNLHVQGRKDNMFVCAGENIHPEGIEQELMDIDGVDFAIVVGVEDAEYGRRPVAFVRTVDGGKVDDERLRAVLRSSMPGIKVPVKFLNWPAGETFDTPKPDRRALAKIANEAQHA
jgi:O-succinylbenzoic acid--CoA ligase